MATRYDLGDNSCRIAVTASDTLTNIFNEISNFLVSKGWLLTNFSVSETAKTGEYTYKGTGVGGTSKFFTISILPKEVGSLEIVGLVNIHDSDRTVSAGPGFGINPANWSSRFFIKLDVANNIYIFASARWALFTSENTKYGVGGVSVSSDDIIEHQYFYTNWLSHLGSMETLGSVLDYKGSSLTVPSEYNYFKQEDSMYCRVLSYYKEQIVSRRLEKARLTAFAKGVTGCVEVLSPAKSINLAVDSVSLACDHIPDSDTRSTNLNLLSARSGIGSPAIRDGKLTRSRMCGLFSADNDFSKLSKGKNLIKNPWNGKNIVSDIHSADVNSNEYFGSVLGLKITQADLSFTTSFLAEVWIKVDSNWNLDPNGQLTKFFVIPGGCEFSDYLPKRNWVWLNEDHTAAIPNAKNFKIDVSRLHGDGSWWIDAVTYYEWPYPIYGYWVSGTVATKKYSHTSFLIPA